MRSPTPRSSRQLAAAVLSTTLVLTTSAAAQDSGAAWWPSGNAPAESGQPAPGQPAFGAVPPPPALPAAQPSAPVEAADQGRKWMVTSPFGNLGWPEVKMPKMQWNPMFGGQESPDASQAAGPNPLSRVKSMTQGVAQRTRAAWNKTVDRFKFRGQPSPRPGSALSNQPGFFARLFGPGEQPSDPQTVPQFLAQKRPGTESR
ncbi:MAG: hypothetical protein AAGB00_07065 [Planctomycetota bacterium]